MCWKQFLSEKYGIEASNLVTVVQPVTPEESSQSFRRRKRRNLGDQRHRKVAGTPSSSHPCRPLSLFAGAACLDHSKCCRLAPRAPEHRKTEPSCLEDDGKRQVQRHCLFRGGVFQNAPNLSPAVISRLTAESASAALAKTHCSARRYVYVWPDGVFLQARMGDHGECILVLIGRDAGTEELIGFQVGVRESAQSWRILVEVKAVGSPMAPEITIERRSLGFWKALDEVFPGTRHQRCWVHKTANVLNKVTLSVQTNMKKICAESSWRRGIEDLAASQRRESVAEGHRRCRRRKRHRGHPGAGKPRRLIASSPKIPHSSWRGALGFKKARTR